MIMIIIIINIIIIIIIINIIIMIILQAALLDAVWSHDENETTTNSLHVLIWWRTQCHPQQQ